MAISTFEADEVVARANVNQRINQANAYFPVSVPNGGTGQTSLTSGNILLGNGTSGITSTSILPIEKGGTGVNNFYQTGTWIPALGNVPTEATKTYSTQNGMYVRIRDMVYVACKIQCTVSNFPSGISATALISGLPFLAEGQSGIPHFLAANRCKNVFEEYDSVVGEVSGTNIYLYSLRGSSIYWDSDFSNAVLEFSGWYKTSS